MTGEDDHDGVGPATGLESKFFRSLVLLALGKPAFHVAAVSRHRVAADEEHDGGENIALGREAEPGWILQRLLDRARAGQTGR